MTEKGDREGEESHAGRCREKKMARRFNLDARDSTATCLKKVFIQRV
jgi:hypothetical protein